MTQRPPQRSKLLGPRDAIPEMDVEECRKLFREHFEILSEYVEGSSYLYRFIGKDYNQFVPDCPARTVPAHHRGTRFAPHCIIMLIEKFEIKEEDFKAGYNAFFSEASQPASDSASALNTKIN